MNVETPPHLLTSYLTPNALFSIRKSLTAISHCLNKRLTFDYCRQLRRAAAVCSNDANSCYHRIVHSVASICTRRAVEPQDPLVCMLTTIQNLRHTVRTAFGDSTDSFGGDMWALPVSGVGQGNGAGPQIWALVSTPILNMIREEGYGVAFKLVISGEEVRFAGYAFVDDTDLCHTAKSSETSTPQLLQEMQDAIDLWEGGIRATGGAIVPPKSHWYLIEYVWKEGRWRYA